MFDSGSDFNALTVLRFVPDSVLITYASGLLLPLMAHGYGGNHSHSPHQTERINSIVIDYLQE